MTLADEHAERIGSEGDFLPYLWIAMAYNRAIKVYGYSHSFFGASCP